MGHRVVITGIGLHSCLGANIEEVTKSLKCGRSGIGYEQERIDMGFQSGLTGILGACSLEGLNRRQKIGIGNPTKFAYCSTKDALLDANLGEDYLNENEIGIIFGNDSTILDSIIGIDLLRKKKDTSLLGSSHIFKSMNSTVTMNLSTIFKIKGINLTVSAACASGSHAVGLGYLLIKNGLQNVVICGGAQEVNPLSMATFDALGVFSKRNDKPDKASRPFDINRDGLVPSGGGATLILEDFDHAVKRGANMYGEIISYSFSSNGIEHLSTPNVEGPTRAMLKSISAAKIQPEEVDYINAHATSTPLGDLNEAMAILKVFGDYGPYVSSTKSMTGHECWMAGASEIIYSLIMMKEGFIAPNINFESPDDAFSKIRIPNLPIEHEINTFLSNSFGFGGTNASVIVKKIK